jgi:hypothetical protein
MLLTWDSTVLVDMNRRWEMSALLRPALTSRRISVSRAVIPSLARCGGTADVEPFGTFGADRGERAADQTLQGAFAGRTAECVGLSQPALGCRLHAGLVENRRDGRTQHVAGERSVPHQVICFGDRL